MSLIKRINNIDKKKLYFVGDIHGMFYMLDDLLEKIGFNYNRDLLISVGDIIDRGPSSHRFLEYLKEPWFLSVMGNHEALMLEALLYPSVKELWYNNGGDWWTHYKKYLDEKEIVSTLKKLPIAIDIDYKGKRIGVLHSQRPTMVNDWNTIVNKLEKLDYKAIFHSKSVNSMIWDRDIIKLSNRYKICTKNVDLLIHGHTITNDIVKNDNHIWIDTGAYKGLMTIIELDVIDGRIKIKKHQYRS